VTIKVNVFKKAIKIMKLTVSNNQFTLSFLFLFINPSIYLSPNAAQLLL